ncbi:hypothetical protein DW115_10500 [Clostridium sp. AM09-51]|nr:hypothetical protein DW115_10500 [Clostridium sp. AM09-51]
MTRMKYLPMNSRNGRTQFAPTITSIKTIKSFAQGGEPPQPRRGIARQVALGGGEGRLVDADEVATVAEQAVPFGSTD